MPAKLRHIATLIGTKNLLTDKANLLSYSVSAALPDSTAAPVLPLAVARPRQLADVAKLLHFCTQEGIQILIRGARTAFAESKNINPDTLLIVTTGLNRIYEIDRGNRLARAQAGVTCQALQEAARSKGLFYPCNPGSAAVCSLGGNIATNAAGPAAVKFGPAANWLENLEVIRSNGESLLCANRANQLHPGFPLARLFCGSGGCLGLIAACVLRLLPAPEDRLDFIFSFADEESAAEAASVIMASNCEPYELEYFDWRCSRVLLSKPDWSRSMIAGAFIGARSVIGEQFALINNMMENYGARRETGLGAGMLTQAVGLIPALAAQQHNCNLLLQAPSAPPASLSKLLECIRGVAEEYGAECAIFGHAGMVRLCALFFLAANDPATPDAISGIKNKLFVLQLMLNNLLESEADATLCINEWQSKQPAYSFAQRLRGLFDPAGILSGQPLPGV